MYEYDYDENKVYEVNDGVRHIALDCDAVEEEFRLGAYAAEALEHLKLHSLDEYMEMVRKGSLREYLRTQDRYELDLEKSIARQTAEQKGREVTPMDEYMARLTATEMMNS
jgi:hypothetical protein